ncbi:hypothetical protein ACTOB_003669 [Actinoplanes oblitus]|uniref:Uncharacterized protein n=1 Tax=Actinoplanes oblitus TaxID=3040509 RepID=A0ABY8WT03_9ACTN|nr:hypothetical protein [Actinoplanes oblitus]WIM99995.1 hypothetical protein ACTOB_003669 [Actinoplanes oblitus]
MKRICAQAITLALTLALVSVASCGRTSTPQPTPPATAGTALTIDDQAEQEHGDDPGAAPSATPAPAAVDAATGYVQAWAHPSLDRAAWYAQLQPLVTPEYAELLADTDPANVPATTVTGAPRVVRSTTDMVVADVLTDAGGIRVTVVNRDGRWLIATVVPAPESP